MESKHWLRATVEAAAVPVTTVVILGALGFGVRVAVATFTIETMALDQEVQNTRLDALEVQSYQYLARFSALEKEVESVRVQQKEGIAELKAAINRNREIILDEVRRRNP